MPKPPPARNGPLVMGLIGFTGFMCIVPLLLQKRHARLTAQQDGRSGLTAGDRPLTPNESRRGVYLNTGSKDVGPDPDWDWRKGTYKGLAPAIIDESTGLAPVGAPSGRAKAGVRGVENFKE